MNHEHHHRRRHRRRRHRSCLDRGRRGRGAARRGRPAVRRTRSRRSRRGRAVVDELAADAAPHYGISTGFGALATLSIPAEKRRDLQRSLVRSHAASTGPEVEREVVRALMLLRLSTLATGHTGVRPETASAYAALLDAGLTPVVREYGSLGCSGDLAPLAHCALALMGEGEVRDADGALGAATCASHTLTEKEGLALINGTDGMLGMLALALHDLAILLDTADVAAAMSVESLLGTDAVFAADLQGLRPHPGQAVSAANIRAVLHGSGIMASHQTPGVHPRAGRVLAALRPAGARRRPRHRRRTRGPSRSASWPPRSTTR